MKVYGASVSYYTGKLETYLRYKGISYERKNPYPEAERIKAAVGAIQHPMVEFDDGRFMSDTTPMIHYLETEHRQRSILPGNPVVRFIALLIEDYADEWLWRPAMHYRWSYEHDRELLSRILADELSGHLKLPRFLRRRMIRRRQRIGFVVNDGVTETTWDHVEAGYYKALSGMSNALAHRPFLLGASPTIADIGMMGPMLRHFGQDPTPHEIMRDEAPLVYDWLSRMWNARAHADGSDILTEVPDVLAPLIGEACETHLAQLAANAIAWHDNQPKMAMQIQGCQYSNVPVSRYRVWCLEQLRLAYADLSAEDQASVQTLLQHRDASLIWDTDIKAESGYDTAREAPFNKAINVFENGVPS